MSAASELETKIAQLSLFITKSVSTMNGDEKVVVGIALSLLSQAQLMIESNPDMARLLFARARKITDYQSKISRGVYAK